jgi:hypothetical protein
MNQRTRYNGFVLEVSRDCAGWKYYVHDFEHPELDCFGTLGSEDAAKKKAVQSAKILGLKVGRIPHSDPLVWSDASDRSRNGAKREAFAMAGSR